jgi:tRNA(fMet)-specific endonuclease VapC
VILDTNAVSALADGDRRLVQTASAVARLSLPVLVIGEFRFGIARSRHRARYTRWLEELISASAVLVVDEETAVRYATIREQLRKQARPIPSNDAWIAALALQHGLPILTRDEHFDHVQGVQRRAW